MKRLNLVQYRRGSLTPDTIEALRHLEMRAKRVPDMELRLNAESRVTTSMSYEEVTKDPGPTGLPPQWSAVPTGREVYLSLDFVNDEGDEVDRHERQLAVLWGLAVPLGFVPWSRYPLPGQHEKVFHYVGPWHPMMDALMGMGRGEEVWPSFCAAAQSDVGNWEGNRPVERMVQSQLHRLGHNCGPVDGIVGNSTEAALRGSGFFGLPLSGLVEKLINTEGTTAPPSSEEKQEGHIILPPGNFSISSYGQVRTVQTPQGASLDISGPGRIVVDLRGT